MMELREIKKTDCGQEEKAIVEKNRMGLVQALGILHGLRDLHSGSEDIYEAFQVVFEWIDNIVILLHGLGGSHENKRDKTK